MENNAIKRLMEIADDPQEMTLVSVLRKDIIEVLNLLHMQDAEIKELKKKAKATE